MVKTTRSLRALALAIVAAGAAATLAPSGAAWAQHVSDVTLRVANYGGRYTDTQRKYAAELFTETTGVKVEFIDGNPVDHIAKLIASHGQDVPFDVVYMDGDMQRNAIDAGVVQKIDPSLVTNLKFLYDEAKNKDGYGPVILFSSVGIAYNADKLKAAGIPAPTSWGDLWDPRLAGKVTIPVLGHPSGRAFLIQAARLAGGDESTLEKGIDKIALLKAHSYYTSTAQLEVLFPAGEIWAAPMASGRAWGLTDRGLPIRYVLPKEGASGSVTTIEVATGTRHPREANLYINAVLSPVAQLGQAFEIPYGPSNRLLAPVIAAYPDLAEKLPGTLEAIRALYQPNWPVYWQHHEEAEELWERKVIHK